METADLSATAAVLWIVAQGLPVPLWLSFNSFADSLHAKLRVAPFGFAFQSVDFVCSFNTPKLSPATASFSYSLENLSNAINPHAFAVVISQVPFLCLEMLQRCKRISHSCKEC